MSLAGVWTNAYGSKMTLAVDANLIMGTYESTTGSSGKYRVIGWQTSADPTTAAGQAAALAIEWHSIVPGQPDNSWHWVSGLSGQLSIQNGAEQLVLSHALVASIEFPGLAPAGTYIDKLIYTRSSEDEPGEPVAAPEEGGLRPIRLSAAGLQRTERACSSVRSYPTPTTPSGTFLAS